MRKKIIYTREALGLGAGGVYLREMWDSPGLEVFRLGNLSTV